MKIKAKNNTVKSMQLMIPYDGIIEIDNEGIAEVSEKAAKVLIECTNDWEYADEKETDAETDNADETTTSETDNVDETATSEADTTETTTSEEKDDEIIDGIRNMSLDAMITMATEAGYPEKDWKKYAKKDKLMAAYLIKQYKASISA